MTDPDAITVIINNDKIEDFYKVYAIDQNYLTLKNMISNDDFQNNINVISKAMSINPIKEVGEKTSVYKTKTVLKSAKETLVERTLQNIKEKGEPANYKWNEFYYGNEVSK